jgi:hypothetical protein
MLNASLIWDSRQAVLTGLGRRLTAQTSASKRQDNVRSAAGAILYGTGILHAGLKMVTTVLFIGITFVVSVSLTALKRSGGYHGYCSSDLRQGRGK